MCKVIIAYFYKIHIMVNGKFYILVILIKIELKLELKDLQRMVVGLLDC